MAMRKTITRSMATSTIKSFKTSIVDGKPEVKELDPVIVAGKVSEKDALKVLKKEMEDVNGVVIAGIETKEDVYEISVEDFIKYATKVTDKAEAENTEKEVK